MTYLQEVCTKKCHSICQH